METLRSFTNRPGMTFDADKTFILYAEDLAQIKENFTLLQEMLSLSRQFETSFLAGVKQGPLPVGELSAPVPMEVVGADVLDHTNTNRGGDVALRGGINTTTNEKGHAHLGSADGSLGYSVAGETVHHRFLPIDTDAIDSVMTDDGTDYLKFRPLSTFESIKTLSRYVSSTPLPFISGNYYDNALFAPALTNLAGVANRFEAFPFYCSQDLELADFGVLCSAEVAGSNIKLAIYDSGDDFLPNNLIFGGGDISTATLGYKNYTSPAVLQTQKLYWFAIRYSSTSAMRACVLSSARSLGASSVTATTFITGLRKSLTYADDWPSVTPFTTSDFVSNIAPTLFRFSIA